MKNIKELGKIILGSEEQHIEYDEHSYILPKLIKFKYTKDYFTENFPKPETKTKTNQAIKPASDITSFIDTTSYTNSDAIFSASICSLKA